MSDQWMWCAASNEKERVRRTERLNVARGLSALAQGSFMKAATAFLRVSREAGQYPGTEVVSIVHFV